MSGYRGSRATCQGDQFSIFMICNSSKGISWYSSKVSVYYICLFLISIASLVY